MTIQNLIETIERHGHAAVEFRGKLMVTCFATIRDDGNVIPTEITEVIEPSKSAVLAFLGY